MDVYQDPIIQEVINFLDANGPSKLQGRYINGDVLSPQNVQLPLCYIAKDTIGAQPVNTMEDEHNEILVATVILSVADDLQGAYNMVAGTPELYELIEARDPTTFRLKEDTLLYNLTLKQQVKPKFWIGVNSSIEGSYGLGVGRRGPGVYSVEASIRFQVKLHLPAPGIDIVE